MLVYIFEVGDKEISIVAKDYYHARISLENRLGASVSAHLICVNIERAIRDKPSDLRMEYMPVGGPT